MGSAVLVFTGLSVSAMAQAETPCLKEATVKVLSLETNLVKAQASVLKNEDGSQAITLIGVGSGYSMYSVFVGSSSTADNTHWEIVEKIGTNRQCSYLSASRFEAP